MKVLKQNKRALIRPLTSIHHCIHRLKYEFLKRETEQRCFHAVHKGSVNGLVSVGFIYQSPDLHQHLQDILDQPLFIPSSKVSEICCPGTLKILTFDLWLARILLRHMVVVFFINLSSCCMLQHIGLCKTFP